MKKNVLLILLGISLGVNIATMSVIAGDITATGMYQKDLHTFLTNVVTMNNELKADVNAATAELNGAATFDAITGFSFGTVATTDLTLSGL
jgi:hypothetical protein